MNIIVLPALDLDGDNREFHLNQEVQFSILMTVVKEHWEAMGIEFLGDGIFVYTAQIDGSIADQDLRPDRISILAGQQSNIRGIELQQAALCIFGSMQHAAQWHCIREWSHQPKSARGSCLLRAQSAAPL